MFVDCFYINCHVSKVSDSDSGEQGGIRTHEQSFPEISTNAWSNHSTTPTWVYKGMIRAIYISEKTTSSIEWSIETALSQ